MQVEASPEGWPVLWSPLKFHHNGDPMCLLHIVFLTDNILHK